MSTSCNKALSSFLLCSLSFLFNASHICDSHSLGFINHLRAPYTKGCNKSTCVESLYVQSTLKALMEPSRQTHTRTHSRPAQWWWASSSMSLEVLNGRLESATAWVLHHRGLIKSWKWTSVQDKKCQRQIRPHKNWYTTVFFHALDGNYGSTE